MALALCWEASSGGLARWCVRVCGMWVGWGGFVGAVVVAVEMERSGRCRGGFCGEWGGGGGKVVVVVGEWVVG